MYRSHQPSEEFVAQLEEDLAPHHVSGPCGHRPKVPLVNLLRNRELGKIAVNYDGLVSESIYRSNSRTFMPVDTNQSSHEIDYESSDVFDHRTRTFYNLDSKRIRQLEGINYKERILSVLRYQPAKCNDDGSVPDKYLILLTDYGRVLFYDLFSRDLMCAFQLPAHSHSFKYMYLNTEETELVIHGISKNVSYFESDANYLRNAERRPTTAVFELSPLVFKALVEFSPEYFPNIHSTCLSDDLLIAFSSKPTRIAFFDFKRLYNENCIHVADYGEFADGTPIPFNIRFTSRQEPEYEVTGNYSGTSFNDYGYMLLEPKSLKSIYSLRDLKYGGKEILSHRLKMHSKEDIHCSFSVEIETTTFFHMDESNRLLRFEDKFLCCYTIRRDEEEPFELNWKTALISNEMVTRIRPRLSALYDETDRPDDVRLLHLDYKSASNFMNIIVAYRVTEPDSVYTDDDWLIVLHILDSHNGSILRMIPLYGNRVTAQGSNTFSVEVHADDHRIVCVTKCQSRYTIVHYAAVDIEYRKWMESKKPIQYHSEAMNRRDKRRQRSRLRNQQQQPMDTS